MRNSYQPETKNKSKLKKSFYHRHKPVISGMGGGVLLGLLMGYLLDDPGLGIAFGLTIGSGYWYTLKKKDD